MADKGRTTLLARSSRCSLAVSLVFLCSSFLGPGPPPPPFSGSRRSLINARCTPSPPQKKQKPTQLNLTYPPTSPGNGTICAATAAARRQDTRRSAPSAGPGGMTRRACCIVLILSFLICFGCRSPVVVGVVFHYFRCYCYCEGGISFSIRCSMKE